MTDLAKLVVKMEANSAQLVKELEQTNKRLGKFERRAKKAGRALGDVGRLAKQAAGILAGGFAVAMGKGMVDAADKVGKLSTRLGISTEALSQMSHVAELSGVSFDTLTMGLQRMTRRVAEAANGSGEAVGALQELGLSAERLNQLSPDQQFEALAEALKNVENPADRVRLAMKLFDSEGVALIQTMQGGAQGIREMRAEADALGLTIGGQLSADAAKTNDQLTRLGSAIRGVFLRVMAQALPIIEQGITAMVRWAKEPGKVAKAVEFLSNTFKVLASGVLYVKGVFEALGKSIGSIAAAAVAVASGEFSRAAEIMRMGGEESDAAWADAMASVEALWAEVPAKIEAKAPAAAEQIAAPMMLAESLVDTSAANIEQRNNDMLATVEKAYSAAAKKSDSIKQKFAERADKIKAPDEKGDPGLFDVATTQAGAQRALADGNVEKATQELSRAFDQLEKLKQSGKESDLVLAGMAERLKRVGEQIGEEHLSQVPMQLKLDQAQAEAQAQQVNALMQQYLDQHPLQQSIQVSTDVAPGLIPAAASEQQGREDLRPVNVTWPNGQTTPMYGDSAGVDDVMRTIEREALKRGSL